MEAGTLVRIKRCGTCCKVVGKVATVVKKIEVDGQDGVEVKFGRGRPQTGRPKTFSLDDLEVVVNT